MGSTLPATFYLRARRRNEGRLLPDEPDPPDLDADHIAELHRLFDPILDEPIPPRMRDLLRRARH